MVTRFAGILRPVEICHGPGEDVGLEEIVQIILCLELHILRRKLFLGFGIDIGLEIKAAFEFWRIGRRVSADSWRGPGS